MGFSHAIGMETLDGVSEKMSQYDQLLSNPIQRSHSSKLRERREQNETDVINLAKSKLLICDKDVEAALQCSNSKAKELLRLLVTKNKLVRHERYERVGKVTKTVISYSNK